MNYLVAVPVDITLAELVGKKGSVNGITFYNRKVNDNVVVAITPSDIEGKFYGVAEVLLVSDQILLSTKQIDKEFGEMLVASSLLNKHVIFTDENEIKALLAGNVAKDFEISSREDVVGKIISHKTEEAGDETRIDIDKSFPVKGVGTVVLGIVIKGKVKVHDTLYHTSGKEVTIRSIQSQDVDIEEADHGARVGLLLKGIEYDEIEKGDLLTSKAVQKVKKVGAKLTLSSFAKEEISDTNMYVLVSNFSYTNARIKFDNGVAEISFEKQIPIGIGDSFLLIRSKQPRIFASGIVDKIG